MLWNKILMVYDGSENALRAAEYVAKMFGKAEGLQVTIFGVYEKIPRHDFKDTSPIVDKLQKQIAAMEIEIERGQKQILDSKALLARSGVDEAAITTKYMERKTSSAAKDIIAEAEQGGYGTIVVGRGEEKGFILAGGNVAKDLVSHARDLAVCVV